jgi:hypothetical protein
VPLRQDLWRAGHAHAGVLLILSLVVLRYVDEAALPDWLKGIVRHTTPAAAILLPTAYFLSVLPPTASEPNGLIYLAFVGAAVLATGLFTLGIGLLRQPTMPDAEQGPGHVREHDTSRARNQTTAGRSTTWLKARAKSSGRNGLRTRPSSRRDTRWAARCATPGR